MAMKIKEESISEKFLSLWTAHVNLQGQCYADIASIKRSIQLIRSDLDELEYKHTFTHIHVEGLRARESKGC